MSLTSWRNLMVPPRLSRSFSDPSSASRIGDSSRRQVALIWMRVRRVCGADRRGLYPSCDAHSCPPSTLVAQRRRDGVDCDKHTITSLALELRTSRVAVPNLNQCIRVGTACDKGVWPFEAAARDGRECASSGHRPTMWQRVKPTRRRPSRLVLGTEGMRT